MSKKTFNDGLKSLTSHLGERLNNVRYSGGAPLSEAELLSLWANSWVVQKICKRRATDMTRRWRDIKSSDLSSDQIDAFYRLEKQLKLQDTLQRVSRWASLLGGCALLVLTDDNPIQPLMPGQIIRRLVVLPPSKVNGIGGINMDVLSDNFGRYDTYTIDGKVQVHYSRLLIMNAVERELNSMQLWGLSDIQAVYETLKRFDFLCTNIGDLVSESKVDVFRMADLNDKLRNGGESQIAQAMQQVQLIKSISNALLIDSANDYEQKELTFAGLTDILREFRNAVAGAADMPVTILFGQSVSGLASGDEDTKNYHETIHGLQEARLRPILDALDPLLLAQVTGGVPVDDFWFDFNSLEDVSTAQKVQMFTTFSQGASPLLQSGVLTEAQVAQELKDLGLIGCINPDDIEAMSDLNHTSYDDPTNSTSAEPAAGFSAAAQQNAAGTQAESPAAMGKDTAY